MAEQVTLDAPLVPAKTVFRIALLALDWQNAHIQVVVQEWDTVTLKYGSQVTVAHYTGAQATNLMIALNKANLTTQSLHQRVIAQLLADGKIPSGTQSGTPD
jgi:hypothetical protein